jgi:hypothetical protein
MNESRQKKSEMLEVRLPHPTKSAFMAKARAEGRPASEIVRESIERYLVGEPTLRQRVGSFVRSHVRWIISLTVAAVAILSVAVAVSPATARPDLKAAFTALDVNGDGVVSQTEFTDPQRALTTDISTAAEVPAARVAIASPAASGTPVYVRFMLDTGTTDGVLPLLVTVDVPASGLAGADIGKLVVNAFVQLDRNGDGRLTADEFGHG